MKPNLAWYTGFMDADGSICFQLKEHGNSKAITWIISVTQSERETLSKFKSFFKVGKIYYKRPRDKNRFYKTNASYQWCVFRTDDVYKVLSMMYPYIQTHKRKQIELMFWYYSYYSTRTLSRKIIDSVVKKFKVKSRGRNSKYKNTKHKIISDAKRFRR